MIYTTTHRKMTTPSTSVPSLLSCPGKHRVSDNRSWYVPLGKTSHECTYCEECYTTFVKGTPIDIGYTRHDKLYSCNCDFPKDLNKLGLQKNDIRVTIVDAKTFKVYSKLENEMANLNGVMHVALPTCTEYIICIENLNTSKDVYFTIESGKIGDKEIVINHGQKIYYKSELEIKGFKTGTNESFMFISQSNQEKSEGKTLEGENVTNVINLKVKKWRREVEEVMGYRGGYRSRGGGDRFGSKGGEATKGFSYDSEPVDACGDFFGSSNSLSGGATISGGSYVGNVQTTTTNDTFHPIDDTVEFLIQLVCNQTEDEKCEINKKYYLKKDLEEREKLLSKKKIVDDNIRGLEEKLQNEKNSLEKLVTELKKYEHLGSSDKEAYLVKF